MGNISKFLNSRKLIHQISFMENLNQNNLSFNENWQEIFNCFAEIDPVNITSAMVMDNVDFGHVSHINLFLFKIRFIKDIKNNMRIRFKARYFDIKRIINILELDKILHITALEI